MKKRFAGAVLAATSLLLGGEEATGKWKTIEHIDIQYRWTLPANNSCEVSFRDMRKSAKTVLRVTTRYRPHKAQKAGIEDRKEEVTFGNEMDGVIHIFGCQDVVSIEIDDVRRN